jgi:hypothetical protein
MNGNDMSDTTPGGAVRLGADPWKQRVDSGHWHAIAAELDTYGGALLPQLLSPGEAEQIRGLYGQAGQFRATINMGRYRFGEGEYRYFAAPYPEPVERLKQALYPRLLPIARDWHARLGRPAPWPDTLDEWLRLPVHHPRPACPIGPRLVSGPGQARRIRHPVRPAAHPRAGLPRRAMSYTLLDADGRPYLSDVQGHWGGHRATRIYGRLGERCLVTS